MHFSCFIISLLAVKCVVAKLTNVTIDDTFGDPKTGQRIIYDPPAAWKQGAGCESCTAKPTPASDAFMGTWHDASFNPSGNSTNTVPDQIIIASVPFTGTAVYVMCILTGSNSSPNGNTDMTFKIDNIVVGNFLRPTDGNTSYQFNVPVYTNTSLPMGLHTITIESGHVGQKALVMLDSIIYTTDDSVQSSTALNLPTGAAPLETTTNSDPQSNALKIAVPVVATILSVTALLLGLWTLRHCLRNRRKDENTFGTPAAFEGSINPWQDLAEAHPIMAEVNEEDPTPPAYSIIALDTSRPVGHAENLRNKPRRL